MREYTLQPYPGKLSWWHRWFDIPSAGELRWYAQLVRDDMALSASDLQNALNTATDEIAKDVNNLVRDLSNALADKEAYADTKVQEALQGFSPIVDRLTALGRDTVTVDEDNSEPLPPSGPEEPAPSEGADEPRA